MQIVRHWSVHGMRRWELRNAPFLEASRRNWKGGGAENGEEREVGPQGIQGQTGRELEEGKGVIVWVVVSSGELRVFGGASCFFWVVGGFVVVELFWSGW